MKNQSANSQTMIKYLLGQLSEEEQSALEEKYFTNADFYEQLLDTEDALIHKYVRKELVEAERELFVRHILSRPDKRKKVKLAQAMMAFTEEQEQKKSSVERLRQLPISIGRAVGAFLTPKTLGWKLAYATAMLFMIFTTALLSIRFKGIQTQLAESEVERQTILQRKQELQQQVEAQRKQNENLAEQLQNEQDQRAELERALGGQTLPARSLVTVTLMPGSPGRDMNKLKRNQIEQGEQLLRLQLRLGSETTYASCRAIIETAEGDTIWSQYQLKARQTEQGKAIILLLPVNIFSYDDYLITLYGVMPSKEIEYVNSYTFNVTKE
jgi:hypothetical protein